MFLLDVVHSFNRYKVPYALVGGFALALHGIVRATVDIDFAIHLSPDDFEQAEQALKAVGLQSRLPLLARDLAKMRVEYIENRNLLAWSFVDYKDPTKQVDLLIHVDLKKIKTTTVSVGGVAICLATLEELKKMKTAANRPQDILDIQRINELLDEKKKSRS